MPSPIAHIAVGGLIARRVTRGTSNLSNAFRITAICIFFSLAPDLDVVYAIFAGDMLRYHNQGTHSLLAWLVICGLTAPVFSSMVKGIPPKKMFGILLLCYGTHLLLDLFTHGRGLKLFWPISHARFRSPLLLFYGLHWSEGIFSMRHLTTLANELVFVVVLAGLTFPLWRRHPTDES